MKKFEILFYNENDQLVTEQSFGATFYPIYLMLYDEYGVETLSIPFNKIFKIEAL